MTTKTVSTRRRFFWKAGAVLSAPLAAVTARDASAEGVADESAALRVRLAMLEDVEAIRELHRTYARLINAQARAEAAALFAAPAEARLDVRIRRLTADRFGQEDVIEVAADRATATARIHCTVETETPIEPRCPLVEMARAQGDGVVRWSERGVLENAYVKERGAWRILRSAYRSA